VHSSAEQTGGSDFIHPRSLRAMTGTAAAGSHKRVQLLLSFLVRAYGRAGATAALSVKRSRHIQAPAPAWQRQRVRARAGAAHGQLAELQPVRGRAVGQRALRDVRQQRRGLAAVHVPQSLLRARALCTRSVAVHGVRWAASRIAACSQRRERQTVGPREGRRGAPARACGCWSRTAAAG
jgi:hypothetical protein